MSARAGKNDALTRPCGVIYLAFGYKFLLLSLASARSLKRHNPHIEVQIITNQKIEKNIIDRQLGDLVNYVTYLDLHDSENRLIKTSIIKYCVFDHAIYLDCDTSIESDISDLFSITEEYDISIRVNPNPYSYEMSAERYKFNIPYSPEVFPHFNGGVFVFKRNPAADAFFDSWHRNFIALRNSADQPALVSGFFECRENLKFLPLPGIFNATSGFLSEKHTKKMVVHHFHVGYRALLQLGYIDMMLKKSSDIQGDIPGKFFKLVRFMYFLRRTLAP